MQNAAFVLMALISAAASPDAAAAVDKLHHEIKRLSREVGDLKVKAAMGGGRVAEGAVDQGNVEPVGVLLQGGEEARREVGEVGRGSRGHP